MSYETVIGLEIHVELLTEHKAFCRCKNAFGDAPNSNKCPICEGLPGAIPIFNSEVLDVATKAGLILNCEINDMSGFDRKNYFYPDLPKGFQITQFYKPLCTNGFLYLPENKKRINISEIHIEEDASKIVRDGDDIFVDYNRCGVPLIEIVTAPDFRNSSEVIEFLEIIRRSFQYVGISDCRIEQGSMRADVNLSVKIPGGNLGTRTETKNMASFKAISRAIEEESKRQIELIESGVGVTQETRRWDENSGKTIFMRKKENSHDYKYHIEPDLLPIKVSSEYLLNMRNSIPELPFEKAKRYVENYGLTPYEANILTTSRELIEFFEKATDTNNLPKDNCNWILTHVLKIMGEKSLTINSVSFAKLVQLVGAKVISNSSGREILYDLFSSDFDPKEYAESKELLLVSDDSKITKVVNDVMNLSENQKAINDYLGGNSKTLGFLIGKAMRALGGKADPSIVRKVVIETLEAMKT